MPVDGQEHKPSVAKADEGGRGLSGCTPSLARSCLVTEESLLTAEYECSLRPTPPPFDGDQAPLGICSYSQSCDGNRRTLTARIGVSMLVRLASEDKLRPSVPIPKEKSSWQDSR